MRINRLSMCARRADCGAYLRNPRTSRMSQLRVDPRLPRANRALHEAITVGPDLGRTWENLGGARCCSWMTTPTRVDGGFGLAGPASRRSGPVLPFMLAVAGQDDGV